MSNARQTEAAELLGALIQLGPWPVVAARELLASLGFRDYHIKRAAADLTQRGELVLLTQRFWATSSFSQEKEGSPLYVCGSSRAELIRRLSERAPAPRGHITTTTDELMEGEGAERLAAHAYDREVNAWGSGRWEE